MCGQKGCSIFWCFLYFMSGFALLGVGIWTPVDDRVFDAISANKPSLMDSKVPWRGWIGGLLALGCYCVLVGILGMAGSACDLDEKIKNSLIAFAVFASLGTIGSLILGAIATAGYASGSQEKYYQNLNDALRSTYNNQDEQNDFIRAWNRYQIDYTCCGAEDFTSYEYSGQFNDSNNAGLPDRWRVPRSCCVLKADRDHGYFPVNDDVNNPDNCQIEMNFATPPTNPVELHSAGCGPIMWERYEQWQIVVMSIAWTATFVQIVAMIVTGCLKKDAKENMYTA